MNSFIRCGLLAVACAIGIITPAGCDQAGSSVATEPAAIVKVSVNKAGQITVDGQPSTPEQLKSKLSGLGQTTTEIVFWAEDPAGAPAQAALKVISESGISRLTMSDAPF